MPLPPALLARLKKRGLVKNETAEEEEEEEVIAEDYDDKDIPLPPGEPTKDSRPREESEESPVIAPAPGCPNKWNIHHECSTFCHARWGTGQLKPNPTVERLRLRMLRKYPLPDGWKELYDPGTGRNYYWKIVTDEVCWLSPSHPRAVVTMPAEKIRAMNKANQPPPEEHSEEEEEEDKSGSDSDFSDEDMEDEDTNKIEQDNSDGEADDRQKSRDKAGPHGRRPLERIDRKGRVRAPQNDLDPMDPASYSNIPRGTWVSGLEK